MKKQTNRDTVVAKLAEWGITLSEGELDELVSAYDNLLRWQGVIEGMCRHRKIAEGVIWPENEPLLIFHVESKGR